ncbi:MAG: hypothetical protein K2N07_00205 [Desulfovibrio sp.]|nr:hypothetical protein [Desulfovibrio sp.]
MAHGARAEPAAIEGGVTGSLCGDEARMAETVKKLLADDELRAKVGRAARTSVEARPGPANVCQNFGARYRRLAGAEHAAG